MSRAEDDSDSIMLRPTVLVSPTDASTPDSLELGRNVREVGEEAVWTVSSCTYGRGVDNLRDGNLETCWQSDGNQPHLVNVQFHRKTAIEAIYIYLDYNKDGSYCPERISIRHDKYYDGDVINFAIRSSLVKLQLVFRSISVRVGNALGDMRELVGVDLEEPTGWVRIPTRDTARRPVRTFLLQIAVLSNHDNGQDTHVRQIKLYSPLQQYGADVSVLRNVHFTSAEFRMFSCIR